MTPRNGVFGVLGVFAATALTATALAVAAPPINPLVEGREPDPVAREFHLPDRPVGGYATTSIEDPKTSAGSWAVFAAGMWDAFLERFTMSLGTAVMEGKDVSSGA